MKQTIALLLALSLLLLLPACAGREAPAGPEPAAPISSEDAGESAPSSAPSSAPPSSLPEPENEPDPVEEPPPESLEENADNIPTEEPPAPEGAASPEELRLRWEEELRARLMNGGDAVFFYQTDYASPEDRWDVEITDAAGFAAFAACLDGMWETEYREPILGTSGLVLCVNRGGTYREYSIATSAVFDLPEGWVLAQQTYPPLPRTTPPEPPQDPDDDSPPALADYSGEPAWLAISAEIWDLVARSR